jgi:hypothetical protein
MSLHRKMRRARTFQTVKMTAAELRKLPSRCAWDGCDQTFADHMPRGWRWMVAYWSPEPIPFFADVPVEDTQCDCVLCPRHAQALDEQLFPLCRLGDMPVFGEG